ncbi:unnamed protein product, partial [Ixodes pacificus]
RSSRGWLGVCAVFDQICTKTVIFADLCRVCGERSTAETEHYVSCSLCCDTRAKQDCGVCLDGKLSLPKDVLLLVTFLRSSPKNDAVLEWSLKINKAEADFKDQNAAAVCLLPLLASYFQENLGELFQLHQVTTEITEEFRDSLPASPVIVALGELHVSFRCMLCIFEGAFFF